MLLSGTGISVATAVFGAILHWFIPFFYGEAARPTLQLIPWLFVAMSISGFAVGAEAFFLVMDKLHIAIRISVISVLISVVPGVWMIAQFQAVGAAAYIALVHGSAGASVVYIFIHARKARLAALATASTAGAARATT
jgi:O-antigen/teichoic acid export membrane protein